MKLIKIACFSGVITSTIVNPFWVMHSKMTNNKKNRDFMEIFRKLMKNHGFKALFKGLSASLILVINPIIQFSIYEILKKKISNFSFIYDIYIYIYINIYIC